MYSKLLTAGLALSIASSLLAQESASSAARKVLPVGSSLHEIRIPRFDENYQKTSLLTAERMDNLPNNKIQGIHVQLELFENGKQQATTHFNSAIFYEGHEILHSQGNLTISGESFDIAAQGVILQWQKRAGFLLGKVQTSFYPQQDTEMHSSKNKQAPSSPQKATHTLTKTSKKLAIITSSIPALLTAEELNKIDELSKPSTEIIEKVDQVTEQKEAEIQLSSQQLTQQKDAISNEVLPVVNGQTKPTEKAKPLANRDNQVPVSVTAENGMYFDAITGTAVYQKNVVVTHPQVLLTCSDELKVLLKKTENSTDSGNKDPEFDGLDKAIATGNVVIKAKDSSGKVIIAHSDIATYDGTTEVIVLKGGRPTIQQGDQIARVLSDSGYIKILPNMSVRIEGKHEITADLNELQNQ